MALITNPLKVYISPNTYSKIREYVHLFLTEAQDQLNNLIADIQAQADAGAFDGPQGPQGEPGPQGPKGDDNLMIINATQEYDDWYAEYGPITFDKTFDEILSHLNSGKAAVVNFPDPNSSSSIGSMYYAMKWTDNTSKHEIVFQNHYNYLLNGDIIPNFGINSCSMLLSIDSNNIVNQTTYYECGTMFVEFTLDSSTGYLKTSTHFGKNDIVQNFYRGAKVVGQYNGMLFELTLVSSKNSYSTYARFSNLSVVNGILIQQTISSIDGLGFDWFFNEATLNNLDSGSY